LLLVDGVKSVAELERLMAAAGVSDGALQLLLEKGLIRFADDQGESQPEPVQAVPSEGTAPVSPVPPVPGAAQPKPTPTQKAVLSIAPGRYGITSPILPESPATLFPPTIVEPRSTGLEIVSLPELETILGEATKLEMETIVGVATMLELTPTTMLAPDTAVKIPSTEPARLPPLAQAEYDFHVAAAAMRQRVVPAAVLQMNLTVARAHLASALDQFLEIDGYALKLRVVASESRAELEQMFPLIAGAFQQKMDKSAATRLIGIAQSLLDR
jgi:hypothetical protein